VKSTHALELLVSMIATDRPSLMAVTLRIIYAVLRSSTKNALVLESCGVLSILLEKLSNISLFGSISSDFVRHINDNASSSNTASNSADPQQNHSNADAAGSSDGSPIAGARKELPHAGISSSPAHSTDASQQSALSFADPASGSLLLEITSDIVSYFNLDVAIVNTTIITSTHNHCDNAIVLESTIITSTSIIITKTYT
jgi:hypothetical protein